MTVPVPKKHGEYGEDQRSDPDCPGEHHVQAYGRQIVQRLATGEKQATQIELCMQAQPD